MVTLTTKSLCTWSNTDGASLPTTSNFEGQGASQGEREGFARPLGGPRASRLNTLVGYDTSRFCRGNNLPPQLRLFSCCQRPNVLV